jgi:hypothetical protein
MPGKLTVSVDQQALESIKARHERAFSRAREEVIGFADRLAPRDSGRLAGSITADGPARRTANGVTGAFGSAERHAAQREFGGPITPQRKRALSWVNKAGVRIVLGPGIRRNFSKIDKETGQRVVFIRGAGVVQKGKPYIRPAAAEFGRVMGDHLRMAG